MYATKQPWFASAQPLNTYAGNQTPSPKMLIDAMQATKQHADVDLLPVFAQPGCGEMCMKYIHCSLEATKHALSCLSEMAVGIGFNNTTEKTVTWCWTVDGNYTAKSTYLCQFEGALHSDDKAPIRSAGAAARRRKPRRSSG